MQLQGLINLFVTIELLDILSMLGCKEQILLVSFCVVRSREVWVSLAVGTEDCKKHATYKMRHRCICNFTFSKRLQFDQMVSVYE